MNDRTPSPTDLTVGSVVSSLRDFEQHRTNTLHMESGRNFLRDKLLARDCGLGRKRLRLQDFVDEKKVREERTQMDRSIQVIDQL